LSHFRARRYNEIWKGKDESGNLKQQHYDDMIYAEKYGETEMELRRIVDEMMRHELDLLQVPRWRIASPSPPLNLFLACRFGRLHWIRIALPRERR
jgi:hypothetical protein